MRTNKEALIQSLKEDIKTLEALAQKTSKEADEALRNDEVELMFQKSQELTQILNDCQIMRGQLLEVITDGRVFTHYKGKRV